MIAQNIYSVLLNLIRESLIKSQNTLSRHTPGQASHFWRMPESSQNNNLLDAGIHQHDEVHT